MSHRTDRSRYAQIVVFSLCSDAGSKVRQRRSASLVSTVWSSLVAVNTSSRHPNNSQSVVGAVFHMERESRKVGVVGDVFSILLIFLEATTFFKRGLPSLLVTF